ncbi:uncharacterized protein LAESUDRAFT_725698 [Laetiporus sulphureus 93-53]|uniref:HNH nuclease domain-containing protein n=1 Tax=Laetiporus sulphureus 93-53 TaxID=1314785 RepID=A0A165EAP8_9APHY|nr:uncharacterized protein LAESUDRAFT_725698 [Laetiporus sulphureus 93-53]KZT06607.1 hypothetical protein LAESUDRAFT_725698 [Laetiporus sulphureus 93-53]
MTALPPVNEVLNSPTEANAKSLYSLVLEAEAAASGHEQNLVRSRILGYLILHPLGDQSRARVLLEIASCNRNHDNRNEVLYQLGEFYLQHFIRPFRKTKGPTPVPSSHPSRPSFDRLQESIKEVLQHSPQDHKTAKSSALIRDDFRCMVTGAVDRASARKYKKVAEQAVGKRILKTECCHIFPESTNNLDGKVSDKVDYAAGVWTVLDMFGYREIREELEGSKIHRLENIMTLTTDIHDMMDCLELWFEEVKDKENCYRIQIRGPDPQLFMKGGDIPSQVQFVAHHNLPLPSPKYLRIHAACCRVAHLSGAAEYLDRVLRDMEELPVLAENGASADVLAHALLYLVPPV